MLQRQNKIAKQLEKDISQIQLKIKEGHLKLALKSEQTRKDQQKHNPTLNPEQKPYLGYGPKQAISETEQSETKSLVSNLTLTIQKMQQLSTSQKLIHQQQFQISSNQSNKIKQEQQSQILALCKKLQTTSFKIQSLQAQLIDGSTQIQKLKDELNIKQQKIQDQQKCIILRLKTIEDLEEKIISQQSKMVSLQQKVKSHIREKFVFLENQKHMKNDLKIVIKFSELMKKNLINADKLEQFTDPQSRQYRAISHSYLGNTHVSNEYTEKSHTEKNLANIQTNNKYSNAQTQSVLMSTSYYRAIQQLSIYNQKLKQKQKVHQKDEHDYNIKNEIAELKRHVHFLSEQNFLLKQRNNNYISLKSLCGTQQGFIKNLQEKLEQKKAQLLDLTQKFELLKMQIFRREMTDEMMEEETKKIKDNFVLYFKVKKQNYLFVDYNEKQKQAQRPNQEALHEENQSSKYPFQCKQSQQATQRNNSI